MAGAIGCSLTDLGIHIECDPRLDPAVSNLAKVKVFEVKGHQVKIHKTFKISGAIGCSLADLGITPGLSLRCPIWQRSRSLELIVPIRWNGLQQIM
jgi:hypothetical protein